MYYHGSSSVVLTDGTFKLLPPCVTGVLSEKGRKTHLDKVFFTKDLGSARIYAGSARQIFGDRPVLFRVIPMGRVECLNDSPGTSVYMTDWAFVEPLDNEGRIQ